MYWYLICYAPTKIIYMIILHVRSSSCDNLLDAASRAAFKT